MNAKLNNNFIDSTYNNHISSHSYGNISFNNLDCSSINLTSNSSVSHQVISLSSQPANTLSSKSGRLKPPNYNRSFSVSNISSIGYSNASDDSTPCPAEKKTGQESTSSNYSLGAAIIPTSLLETSLKKKDLKTGNEKKNLESFDTSIFAGLEEHSQMSLFEEPPNNEASRCSSKSSSASVGDKSKYFRMGKKELQKSSSRSHLIPSQSNSLLPMANDVSEEVNSIKQLKANDVKSDPTSSEDHCEKQKLDPIRSQEPFPDMMNEFDHSIDTTSFSPRIQKGRVQGSMILWDDPMKNKTDVEFHDKNSTVSSTVKKRPAQDFFPNEIETILPKRPKLNTGSPSGVISTPPGLERKKKETAGSAVDLGNYAQQKRFTFSRTDSLLNTKNKENRSGTNLAMGDSCQIISNHRDSDPDNETNCPNSSARQPAKKAFTSTAIPATKTKRFSELNEKQTSKSLGNANDLMQMALSFSKSNPSKCLSLFAKTGVKQEKENSADLCFSGRTSEYEKQKQVFEVSSVSSNSSTCKQLPHLEKPIKIVSVSTPISQQRQPRHLGTLKTSVGPNTAFLSKSGKSLAVPNPVNVAKDKKLHELQKPSAFHKLFYEKNAPATTTAAAAVLVSKNQFSPFSKNYVNTSRLSNLSPPIDCPKPNDGVKHVTILKTKADHGLKSSQVGTKHENVAKDESTHAFSLGNEKTNDTRANLLFDELDAMLDDSFDLCDFEDDLIVSDAGLRANYESQQKLNSPQVQLKRTASFNEALSAELVSNADISTKENEPRATESNIKLRNVNLVGKRNVEASSNNAKQDNEADSFREKKNAQIHMAEKQKEQADADQDSLALESLDTQKKNENGLDADDSDFELDPDILNDAEFEAEFAHFLSQPQSSMGRQL